MPRRQISGWKSEFRLYGQGMSSARQAWQEGMKKLGTQVFEAGPNLYAVDNDSMFTPQKLAKKDDRK
ncbi:hypothetical protein OX90_05250 [Pseudomonas coronafaciens pv. porri]|nr:hypothetical protein OX88_04655 [Pseudomonas coronafaciens pv. porri]KOP60511.1 hypothetical protein OX90_05250 [Pseudomonas coronafaciens pv. porri]